MKKYDHIYSPPFPSYPPPMMPKPMSRGVSGNLKMGAPQTHVRADALAGGELCTICCPIPSCPSNLRQAPPRLSIPPPNPPKHTSRLTQPWFTTYQGESLQETLFWKFFTFSLASSSFVNVELILWRPVARPFDKNVSGSDESHLEGMFVQPHAFSSTKLLPSSPPPQKWFFFIRFYTFTGG